MANVINRINNEFSFNYQKFVRNNNIAETTIKTNNFNGNFNNKFNGNSYDKPVEVETMDFDVYENPKEKEVEVLTLDD